jgi:hypothetical protein
MAMTDPSARALLEAIDEPAFIVARDLVHLANEPAKAVLGRAIEGSDVRLAVRHPKLWNSCSPALLEKSISPALALSAGRGGS